MRMATCPKCGRKLKLTQWRPECPGCGVNMVYYDSNERLIVEAEKAEVEHAKSQPGNARNPSVAKPHFTNSRLFISMAPRSCTNYP